MYICCQFKISQYFVLFSKMFNIKVGICRFQILQDHETLKSSCDVMNV